MLSLHHRRNSSFWKYYWSFCNITFVWLFFPAFCINQFIKILLPLPFDVSPSCHDVPLFVRNMLYPVYHCLYWNGQLVCTPASRRLIDDFRGACAVKGNVQVAGRTSSLSTTEMLSTHDVTLRNVDSSLFHVQI